MLCNMLGLGVTYMCISFMIINKLRAESEWENYVIIYSKTKAYSHNCKQEGRFSGQKRMFIKLSHLSSIPVMTVPHDGTTK